jgi:hypothetical protein
VVRRLGNTFSACAVPLFGQLLSGCYVPQLNAYVEAIARLADASDQESLCADLSPGKKSRRLIDGRSSIAKEAFIDDRPASLLD